MREVSAMPQQEARAIEPIEEPAASGVRAVEPPAAAGAVEEPKLTREQRRSRRARGVRARTVSMKRMTRRELELGRMLYPDDEHADLERPRTRADCEGGARPCPFVSCAHHLYLDVSARTGAIKLNFPDLEVWELPESCALDVAGRGGTTLEGVGAIMNLTRERVRQMEVTSFAKIRAIDDLGALREYAGEELLAGAGRGRERPDRRRLPILSHDEESEEQKDGEDAEPRDEVDAEHFASAELDDDGI